MLPHLPILARPTVDSIREELRAESLNGSQLGLRLVDDVVIGAMSVQNAMRFFQPGVLVITPGDREDIVQAAAASGQKDTGLAGIVLTGNLRPSEATLETIRGLSFPVLLAADDSYEVASKVHNLIVKTRPADTKKIQVIFDLIEQNLDIPKILKAL